jgi:predicted acylesterase/phospholipase RssA
LTSRLDLQLSRQLRHTEKLMAKAETYPQWLELAQAHDDLSGGTIWRRIPESRRYDHLSIRRRLDRLQELRLHGNDAGLLFALNEGIHGNMAGMGNAALHRRAKCGTKHLIEEYIDAICDALEHLAREQDNPIPLRERLEFFRRASHCYGRSALMLSGGGTLGFFHFGVLKALIEQQLCPVVISGASAGSFVAAVVGTRTDSEYLALFQDNFLARSLSENRNDLHIGFGMDEEIDMPAVREEMAKLIPDLTFQEAFERTGRSINITITPARPRQESRLLNHIASPNVTIRSAVLASSALPGVFPPAQLEAKDDRGVTRPYLPQHRWIDGSFSQDLPAKRLARMYGVNHFIVSQVMPGLGREPGPRPLVYGILADAWLAAGKQLVRGSLNAAQRYARVGSRSGAVMNAINGLIDQTFSGDINIFPPYGVASLAKLLKVLSEEELLEIFHAGECGTWPRLPAIATTTRIGRTLDRVLHRYELREAHWLSKAPRTEPFRSPAGGSASGVSAPAKGGAPRGKAATRARRKAAAG